MWVFAIGVGGCCNTRDSIAVLIKQIWDHKIGYWELDARIDSPLYYYTVLQNDDVDDHSLRSLTPKMPFLPIWDFPKIRGTWTPNGSALSIVQGYPLKEEPQFMETAM